MRLWTLIASGEDGLQTVEPFLAFLLANALKEQCMTNITLDRLLEEVKTLSSDEQRQLWDTLDA